MTDREALALAFPLREAQEIIAIESGLRELGGAQGRRRQRANPGREAVAPPTRLTRAVPVIFVADVQAAAEFYSGTLGFSIDFLHGHPPFYGAVSRDGACVHLKFVHEPGSPSVPKIATD